MAKKSEPSISEQPKEAGHLLPQGGAGAQTDYVRQLSRPKARRAGDDAVRDAKRAFEAKPETQAARAAMAEAKLSRSDVRFRDNTKHEPITIRTLDDTRENENNKLPARQTKNDYALLEEYFDVKNVPLDKRAGYIDIFQHVIAPAGNLKTKLELPTKAPKLYVDRPQGQNIIDFLRDPKGWGPYVAAGVLTRPDLRRLDRKAYDGLTSWLQHHSLPPDMSLPSKSAVIDDAARQITAVAGVTDVTVRRVAQTLASRQRRKPVI